MKFQISNQKGFIVSITVFFALTAMVAITVSMAAVAAASQKISTNAIKSTQSYYAAESGVEDALLRLRTTPQMSATSYNFTVNGVTSTVTIPAIVGSSRAVTAQGTNGTITRKLQVTYTIDSTNVDFYYGVQVGTGGLSMGSNSRVMGNVFSGGNITGSGTIDNNVIVSGNGNKIQNIHVKGNAMVYTCQSATVDGNLTYVTGGTNNCSVGGSVSTQSQEISQQPLPIPESQIDEWKDEVSGTACNATLVAQLSQNNKSASLGPCKITGNLLFGNNTTLTLTGTLYVTGTISMGNGTTIRLDSSYATLGGVLIADGAINTGNSANFSGSGQAGSYLLVLSTSTLDNAITVNNNATGAAFYALDGGITLPNNVSVLEATAKKLTMGNNAIIQSSSGIVNIFFSSGPGGAWKVTDWSEQ